jgi:hypothetical protein
MSDKTKLIAAMSGIEAFAPGKGNSIFNYKNVSTGNFDPPAYIVAFIFFYVLKFRNFGSLEKVWWHTYFQYKNTVFLIRDFKFGTWSLETKTDSEAAIALVPEIIGKIRAAARHSDRILKSKFKAEMNRGQFYLNNGYGKLRSAYEFFLEETKAALMALEDFTVQESAKEHDLQDIAENHNKRLHLQNIVSYRAIPLITAFFSLLEFILDIFYAFQQPELSFFEFSNLTWQDRFKAVISLEAGSPVIKVYEQIVNVKTQYRNPHTHGLTNESSLLVPFPFAGLVPVSYEHLSNTVHFAFVQISSASVRETIKTFGDFLDIIANEEPYCYYVLYADHGFPVPVAKNAVEQIRKEMTDYQSFEEYLQNKSLYKDAVTNRDIEA